MHAAISSACRVTWRTTASPGHWHPRAGVSSVGPLVCRAAPPTAASHMWHRVWRRSPPPPFPREPCCSATAVHSSFCGLHSTILLAGAEEMTTRRGRDQPRRSDTQKPAPYVFPTARALDHLRRGQAFHRTSTECRSDRLRRVAAKLRHQKRIYTDLHEPVEDAEVAIGEGEAVEQKEETRFGGDDGESWRGTAELEERRRSAELEAASRFAKYHAHHLVVQWKQWSRRTTALHRQHALEAEEETGRVCWSTHHLGKTVKYLSDAALLLRVGALYGVAADHVEKLLGITMSTSLILSQALLPIAHHQHGQDTANGGVLAAFPCASWPLLQYAVEHYCEAVQLWELQHHSSSLLFSPLGATALQQTSDILFHAFTKTCVPFAYLLESTSRLLLRGLQVTNWNYLYRHAHHSLLQLSSGSKAHRQRCALRWFGFEEEEVKDVLAAIQQNSSCRMEGAGGAHQHEESAVPGATRSLPASICAAQQRQLQLLPIWWLSLLCTYKMWVSETQPLAVGASAAAGTVSAANITWQSLRRAYAKLLSGVLDESSGLEPATLAVLQIVSQPDILCSSTAAGANASTSKEVDVVALPEMLSVVSAMERSGVLQPGLGGGAYRKPQEQQQEEEEVVERFFRQWVLDWAAQRERLCTVSLNGVTQRGPEAFRSLLTVASLGPLTTSRLDIYAAIMDTPLSLFPLLREEAETHTSQSTTVLAKAMVMHLVRLLLQWRPPAAPSPFVLPQRRDHSVAVPIEEVHRLAVGLRGHYAHHHRVFQVESLLVVEAGAQLHALWYRLAALDPGVPPRGSRSELPETVRRAYAECRSVIQAVLRSLSVQLCGLVHTLQLSCSILEEEQQQCTTAPPTTDRLASDDGGLACAISLGHPVLDTMDVRLLEIFDAMLRDVLCGDRRNAIRDGCAREPKDTEKKAELEQQLLQLPLLYAQMIVPLLSGD